MQTISRIFVIAGMFAALQGCTDFKNRVYAGSCDRQGIARGTPEFSNCMQRTAAEDLALRRQETGQILVGATLIAGAAAASVSTAAAPPQTTRCTPGPKIGDHPPTYTCRPQ